jgi:hypothetical protein
LTTLRHDSFSQSLAHGCDGTVLLHRINFCHDHQSLGKLDVRNRFNSSLPAEFEVPKESELRTGTQSSWWTPKQLVVVAVHAPVSPPPAILSVTLSQQNGLREKIQKITINSMVET